MTPARYTFDAGSNPEQMSLFDGSEAPAPPSPVRAVSLPQPFTAKIGASSDPITERLLLARAAYLNRRADESTLGTEKGSIYLPTSEPPKPQVRKRSGRAVGLLRGIAEDIWRRVFKRAVPKVADGEVGKFIELFRRVRMAAQQSEHILLSPLGGTRATHPEKDLLGDFRGRGLPLSMELEAAAQGRLAPPPPLFVRSAGPEPSGRQDFWTEIERRAVRRANLHQTYAEAISSRAVGGDRRPANPFRSETKAEPGGADGPRQISVGRWRPGETQRPDRKNCAVRVPWLVARLKLSIDGGRRWQIRRVKALLHSLPAKEIDFSNIVLAYSGGSYIQVRFPEGLVGAPIYRNAYAAAQAIRHFFDRLCPTEKIRSSIDERLFHPDRLVPTVGSVDPATGRHIVGTDAETFLESPVESLLGYPEQKAKFTRPGHFPSPHQADFHWLPYLLLSPGRKAPDHKRAGGAVDGEEVGHVVRQRHSSYGHNPSSGTLRARVLNDLASGVAEGENWGTAIDPWYRGRYRAAIFVTQDALRSHENRERAWRSVQAWNRRNSPPLPKGKLRLAFEEALDDWPGW